MELMQGTIEDKENVALVDYKMVTFSLAGKDYCVWDMEYPNYETITFDIDNNGLYVGIIDGKIVSAISLVKDLELTSYNWKENSNVIELSRFGVLKVL